MMVSIIEYTDFFHDGSVLDIRHQNNIIELSMSSAEMDKDDLQDPIKLSKSDCMVGKLHIEGIKHITVDDELLTKPLKKEYDNGHILDFEINGNMVTLAIQWVNYPRKPEMDVFSIITIVGQKIYWENIPDLEDAC